MANPNARIERQEKMIKQQDQEIKRLRLALARSHLTIEELREQIWGNRLAKREAENRIRAIEMNMITGAWK